MEYQTILFKKNPVLFKNEAEALDALRSMKFTMGEPVIAMYGPSWREAKLILAIGKRTATGESAFDIVATSSDTNQLGISIANLETKLSDHEDVLANGNTPGHVLSGRNISYVNGYGYVNQLAHKISFSGQTTGEFNGSQDVNIEIPAASNTNPKENNPLPAPGTSNRWAREDHVHPTQKNILGNAGSATKLENPKTISITGAVTGSTTTDLSGNVIIDTLVTHTHPSGDITGIQDIWDAINTKAPIISPTLEGTPETPTPAEGISSNQIANTEFVINEITNRIEAVVALGYKGTLGTSGTITSLPVKHKVGDVYLCISGSPNINGRATSPGDMVICTNTSENGVDSDWNVVQANIYTSITSGDGLIGGGDLREGNITLSHQAKPDQGEPQGGNEVFVTEINVDKFGHISNVIKSSINGRVSAGNGKYVSDVWVDGSTIVGNSQPLPTILITNGEVEPNQFITGLSVGSKNNSHNIIVSKRSLIIPDIEINNGTEESGSYVSSVSAMGHTLTIGKTSLPPESGKVKISEDGIADYLGNKIVPNERSRSIYPVDIETNGDKLELSVNISEIDGNSDQIIKLKRSNISGQAPESLEEGEIYLNTFDKYLYTNDGTSIVRIYQNATHTYDGLMSAADKERLDQLSLDVGDIGNVSSVIEELRENLEDKITEVNNYADDINLKLTEEINNRTNDTIRINNELNSKISSIQLGSTNDEHKVNVTPVSGIAILPPASSISVGVMTSEDYVELYTNIPEDINNTKNVIDAYTINGYKISENPVLDCSDILLTRYTINEEDDSQLSSDDTVNIAFSKLQTQINNEVNSRITAISDIRNLLNNEITNRENAITDLEESLTEQINNVNTELTERIDNILDGNELSSSLQDTHYLRSSGNLLEALKTIDNKLYEIEQSMLSSVLVRSTD